MKEERVIISKNFFAKQAPCVVSYPVANGFAKVFIAHTGEVFGCGYTHTYSTLDKLCEMNSEHLLQMFSGEINAIEYKEDLSVFTYDLIDNFEWMRGHYGKPNIPHPSEIQKIEERYHELVSCYQSRQAQYQDHIIKPEPYFNLNPLSTVQENYA